MLYFCTQRGVFFHSKYFILFLLAFNVFSQSDAQVIWQLNGPISYTDIDSVAKDNYGPFDVGNCNSFRFEMDFNFPTGWAGQGNMDSADECSFGVGCVGDINNPRGGSCSNCWDFMYIEVSIDGRSVFVDLIGVPGRTPNSGQIFFDYSNKCMGSVSIRILNQNNQPNETNTFSNLRLTCLGSGTVISPQFSFVDTICAGDLLMLPTTSDNGVAGTWTPQPTNTITTKYTFTPDTINFPCADIINRTVFVKPQKVLASPQFGTTCANGDNIVLPVQIDNIPGLWTLEGNNITNFDPKIYGNGTFTLVFRPSLSFCAETLSTSINVHTVTAGRDSTLSLCAELANIVDLNAYLAPDASLNGVWKLNDSVIINASNYDLRLLTFGKNDFFYIVNDPACGLDTAFVSINIVPNNKAGNDQSNNFCEGAVLNLFDYLGTGASKSGFFYNNGVKVSDSLLATGTKSFFDIIYKVNENSACPVNSAFISLVSIPSPKLTWTAPKDLCQDQCFTLGIISDKDAYIKMIIRSDQGQTFSTDVNLTSLNLYATEICSKPAQNINFNNLPTGATYKFYIDSLKITDRNCVFFPKDTFSFLTKKLLERNIDLRLCRGQVYTVNGDIYNESKTSGQTIIASSIAGQCDSLINVSLTYDLPSPPTTITTTTCNDNFSIQVGSQLFNKARPIGQVLLQNKLGCDSLIIVDIKFETFSTGTFIKSTCTDTLTFQIGGQIFNKTQPKGTVTLAGASALGCDSIVSVDITYLSAGVGHIKLSTCDDTYSFTKGGIIFNKSFPTGMALLAGASQNGCDSLIMVDIVYLPKATFDFRLTTCDTAFTFVSGGRTFDRQHPSGAVTLVSSAQNGCDSTININITYLPDAVHNLSLNTCIDTFSVVVNGTVFNSSNPSGKVIISKGALNGCDSIVNVSLNFQNRSFFNLTRQTCDSSVSVNVGNEIFNLSRPTGRVILPGRSAIGCDSIVDV
ncbi:MAG: hypothetical protein WBO36_14265, partial [Saprospiraceae bacterium]